MTPGNLPLPLQYIEEMDEDQSNTYLDDDTDIVPCNEDFDYDTLSVF